MDLASLQQQFAAADFLTFEQINGLMRIQVKTAQASATIYLQGAHLTSWQPAGFAEVIHQARGANFGVGRPAGAGIPVVFPWFANDHQWFSFEPRQDRINGHPGPSHGFARTQPWTLTSATRKGSNAELVLELAPNDVSRSMGFDHFRLTMTFLVGRTLTLALKVTNHDAKPLIYEEDFHHYFAVGDIHEVEVRGLEPTSYIDKVDGMKLKPASHAPIRFTGMVDRIYEDTTAECVIVDEMLKRRIRLRKLHSNTTVVWNPWESPTNPANSEWHEFVAVEVANAAKNTITLQPADSHTMGVEISVENGLG